jgi:hypothetical protein
VQAVERAGVEAMVVAPFGDKSQTGYTSKIIVKAGSPVKTLQNLRGKTFAFCGPSFTSGNYVPTLELVNAFLRMTNEDIHTNGKFFLPSVFPADTRTDSRPSSTGMWTPRRSPPRSGFLGCRFLGWRPWVTWLW